MTYQQYLQDKCLHDLGMRVLPDGGPAEDEQNVFINSRDDVRILKIREMDTWYASNDSGLKNFYTKNNLIDYNYEPLYWRGKKSYFWAVSSTEEDYKCTTSGLAEAIIDGLVNIISYPKIDDPQNEKLKVALENTNFFNVYHDKQLPKTLVEGYGAYKIDWDLSLSPYPFVNFYTAENVDFVVYKGFVVGVVFKDWYDNGEGQKYLVCETRHFRNRLEAQTTGAHSPVPAPKLHKDLVIEMDCFRVNYGGTETQLEKIDNPSSVPCLKGIEKGVVFSDFPYLLAKPSVFFPDPENLGYGRGVLQSKISLLDDLDQSLSQSSNADRASTPEKIYDTNYLERDDNGLPKQPKCFDRKYTYVNSPRDSSGGISNAIPVNVIQPQLNFAQYTEEQLNIATHILQGILSPATLGIDVSRKDNSSAQREKEKVTVFTRNAVITRETEILKDLMSQYEMVMGYLETGKLYPVPHDVSVKFSEFADESFENKLNSLVGALVQKSISPEMFVDKLYGKDSLSEEEREREVGWITQNYEPQEPQLPQPQQLQGDGGIIQ